ncbi:autotransporter outer membrane beta-barrel domain-containing protein [Sandaracinobacteroides sayramensis]|uniref:autotransporter outer membrane beta-barrel domain-containing protein n=1 Tax=Sandaracinobacteroides sayramensis TaxID=2913411 RepID=UPI002105BE6C|nr:autotransporter outer membrane beta-barrel domain-containing protein [Sandaracinobacteroides sayramensis]
MTSRGGTGQRGANGNASGGGWGGDGGLGGNLTFSVIAAHQMTPTGVSNSIASGITVQSIGGTGGGGGVGPGGAGQSGRGGDGGTVTVGQLDGYWVSLSAGTGAFIASFGGTGGTGRDYDGDYKFGANGFTGGDGNVVNATLTGSYAGYVNAVKVSSSGGDGGGGGKGDSAYSGQGGNGGNGGNGGDVTVVMTSTAHLQSGGPGGAALWVLSSGGRGGVGGGGELGGTGGEGGNAGNVNVTLAGQILTDLPSDYSSPAPGLLAQSLGNVGGGGGHASDWSFNPTGGDGGTGGTAGTVTVQGSGVMILAGSTTITDISPGVLAQSIGGLGGVGPDQTGIFAVGGSGGKAANGNTVSVALSDASITTSGFGSGGIVAQSIGGGGGKGGDATSNNGVLVGMTIGGTGGAGGAAGSSYAANLGGLIQTKGDHSPGIMFQSIGGGGGSGGSSYDKVHSGLFGAAISVGGNGSAGGDGGAANPDQIENNSGRILTTGKESFGILGQSIGGGGGQGGASTAKSIVKGASDYPSFSLALATGGNGGTAGDALYVFADNDGLIATSGNGSIGILAQSIGGGGGSGGDANASSDTSAGSYSLSASVAHGGKGQSGGNGAKSWAGNGGLIITTGESADGMLVQSIGGGGGSGGAGDAKATTKADNSLGLDMSIGGQAGNGGTGGTVKADNSGSILTLGDGAHGIITQTIGGGGGRGGGAAGSNSGTLGVGVVVGGSGGNGGGTWDSSAGTEVTNSGSIVTFGADAGGILAQSIGGGGGAGGKAGTSLGDKKNNGDGSNGSDASVSDTMADISNDFANGTAIGSYASLDQLLAATNKLLGNGNSQLGDGDDIDNLDSTSATGGENSDDNEATSISINVGVGGNGGNGGAAGAILVTNAANATVATMGKHSDAIVAQAIGGGGGKGGGASTASSGTYSGGINIGGKGGNNSYSNANNGGQPTVVNLGTVYTVGALSSGIVAQSIAGGGGIGGTSSVTVTDSNGGGSGQKSAITATLGGAATVANGSSQVAQVTNSGTIETRGHDSYGIIAQSISGGGGILKTLATNLDTANGSISSGASKDFNVDLRLGATGSNISGNAGAVFVTTNGAGVITTRGDNGVGILAQTVAAGGGLALGGKPQGSQAADFLGAPDPLAEFGKKGSVNSGLSTNPADMQGVHVNVGANIVTYGAGAVGVFAQSVGGSGGIAGDIGNTMQLNRMGAAQLATAYIGDGGDISVNVAQGATIVTGAQQPFSNAWGNAPGIIAQSVGGGGGWFTNSGGAYIGSAGGTGNGGVINIDVQGTVDARGPASAGIFAQSTGGGDNGGSGSGGVITITIGGAGNKAASVWGGNGFGAIAAAVYIRNGASGSSVTNYGVVNTHESTDGYAFYSDSASFQVQNYGIVTGNTNIGGNFINEQGGTYVPLSTVNLNGGTLTNAGVLHSGSAGKVTSTILTGHLHQQVGGVLHIDADMAGGKADSLSVSGTAVIAGTVHVAPTSVSNRAMKVLSAAGGLTLDPSLAMTDSSHLYDFRSSVSGHDMSVSAVANFKAKAAGFGANEKSVAASLQSLFDGGASADTAFTRLLTVADDAGYAAGLKSLAGQGLGAFGAFRFNSSRTFAGNLTGGCAGLQLEDRSTERCGWARVLVNNTTQEAATDTHGYRADAWAMQIGGQTPLSDDLALTGSVAYEGTTFHDESRSARIKGDTLLAGLGLLYTPARFELSAGIDAAYGWYKSRRTISLGLAEQANASPKQSQLGGHARAAYNLLEEGKSFVRPFVEGHAIHVSNKAFTETGNSPFRLAVEGRADTALIGVAGVEMGTALALSGKVTLRPFASAVLEYGSPREWTTTARFAEQPQGDSFDLKTAGPGTLGRFSIGADLLGAKNVAFSVQYAPELGKDFTSHSGTARLTIAF